MRKLLLNLFLSTVGLLFAGQASAQKEIAPGIIKLQAGEIDTFTPYSLFGGKPAVEAMKQLPAAKPPFSPDEVQIKITDRGCLIEVPLEDNEQIYGFGLQFRNFRPAWPAQAPDSKRQSAERTRIYTCSADILRLYQRVRYSGQHGTVYHFPMRLQSENRA
ncbi:hypothetical protein NXV46_04900 [Bacteroides thetaiotaomicron]|nr:hypothetical protein NXV46_04900 [Bacteroides thetaiotaomicron]